MNIYYLHTFLMRIITIIYHAEHFSLIFNWNSNDVNESNTCDYKIHYFLSCTFHQNSLKITIVITNHVQTWKLKNNCELCWRNSILIESTQSHGDAGDQWQFQLLIEPVVKKAETMRRPINQHWFLKADWLVPSESPDSARNLCKISVQNIISLIA